MVIKRKRSDCELGSMFSSEQRPDSGSFNFNSLSAMDTARRGFFAPRVSMPSHLNSRTMKRFRDNRPSESQVFQHTLDVLYSAQRRSHNEPQPVQPTPAPLAHELVHPHMQSFSSSQQQRSLHSFWSLPQASPSSSTSSVASSPAASTVWSPSSAAAAPFQSSSDNVATHCEDCGAGLAGGDGDDDVMMDVDAYALSLEDHACGACGKAVCFSCSISNLGEHRRCLSCAAPRSGEAGSSSWFIRKQFR